MPWQSLDSIDVLDWVALDLGVAFVANVVDLLVIPFNFLEFKVGQFEVLLGIRGAHWVVRSACLLLTRRLQHVLLPTETTQPVDWVGNAGLGVLNQLGGLLDRVLDLL